MDQSPLFKINNFKSGFVSVIGFPNVGKSTLINSLLGQKLSIVSNKVQTTRCHIKAILNGKDYQIIFIDTPGFIKPFNIMEKNMVKAIDNAIKNDADLICLVVEPGFFSFGENHFIEELKNINTILFLVINKIDIYSEDKIKKEEEIWKKYLPKIDRVFKISAKTGTNITVLKEAIISSIPFSPPYYEEHVLSDRWERFFVAEIIRENIFNLYSDEIPYGCAVDILEFVEEKKFANIVACIYMSKKSYRPILLGKRGSKIIRLKKDSQEQISSFINRNVNLKFCLKVKENWENDANFIKKYYNFE